MSIRPDLPPPPRAQALIDAELRDGETQAWSGRPIPRHAMWAGVPGGSWLTRGPALAACIGLLSLFALPGAAFTWLFAQLLFSPSGLGDVLYALAMLPLTAALTLAPLYWAAVRPRLAAYRKARDLHYVLTNERALIFRIRDGGIEDWESKALHEIDDVRLEWRRSDGSGDLIYDTGGYLAAGSRSAYSVLWDVGFIGVPDAEHVRELLQNAIDNCPHDRSAETRELPVGVRRPARVR